MRLEGSQTKVLVAKLVCIFSKVVRLMFCNELLSDNVLEIVTIHHSLMRSAYSGTAKLFKVSGPRDLFRTLKGVISTGIYVWSGCKLVLGDGKAGAPSRKSNVSLNDIRPDSMENGTSVLSGVHLLESGSPIRESGSQSISNTIGRRPSKSALPMRSQSWLMCSPWKLTPPFCGLVQPTARLENLNCLQV